MCFHNLNENAQMADAFLSFPNSIWEHVAIPCHAIPIYALKRIDYFPLIFFHRRVPEP